MLTLFLRKYLNEQCDTPAPYIRSGMKIAAQGRVHPARGPLARGLDGRARGQQLNAGQDIGGRSNIPFLHLTNKLT